MKFDSQKLRFIAAFFGVAVMLVIPVSNAKDISGGGISISPVKIVMDGREGSVKVANNSNKGTDVRLVPFKWEQKEGKDIVTLLEGKERNLLVVAPPVFHLKPGEVQIVRVLSRAPEASKTQFRLGIVEPEPLGGQVLHTMSRLPVFTYAAGKPAELDIKASREGSNINVQISNIGDRYERINAWMFGGYSQSGNTTRSKFDVLPGSTKTMVIPDSEGVEKLSLIGEGVKVYEVFID